jgi:hypothetical protein
MKSRAKRREPHVGHALTLLLGVVAAEGVAGLVRKN